MEKAAVPFQHPINCIFYYSRALKFKAHVLDGTFDAVNGALVLQVDLEVSLTVLEVAFFMRECVWLLIMSSMCRSEVRGWIFRPGDLPT